MTKSNFTVTLYLGLLISTSSCVKSDHNECISYKKAPVTKVDGPKSGSINQGLPLTISFTYFDGCGESGQIEQSTTVDTTMINVIGRYRGCICTLMLTGGKTVYNFKAARAGTFYLKFWAAENTYLMDTVVIR